jgi:tetratricopeptide (TPR) repeat protein
MNATGSDSKFRPVCAGFILALLFFSGLTAGCSQKESPPGSRVTQIAAGDAAQAGSMALYMQGLLYESATNPLPEKAAAAYLSALTLDPGNKNALASLVHSLSGRKRFDEAYQALSDHRESIADDPKLMVLAAGLAEHLGRPSEAAQWCAQVLTLAPTNGAVANAAIRFQFESGAERRALATLERFTGQLPRDEALRFTVDTIVSLYGDQTKTTPLHALRCCEVALRFAKGSEELSDILMLQAYCQLEAAQTNNAARTFEQSFTANPNNFIPLTHLGRIYAAEPELRATLEARSRSGDDDALTAMLILGYAYNAMERPQEAAAVLSDYYARRMRRGYFARKDFYLALGFIYEKLKAYERIDTLFRDAVCAYPDDPEILNFIAYLWSERGINLTQALIYIDTALAQDPDNPAYLDTKGWILHKSGRHYEALQQLLKACAGDNREPVILDHTGDVLDSVGDDLLAIDFWKMSYALDPQPAVAQKLRRAGEPLPGIEEH